MKGVEKDSRGNFPKGANIHILVRYKCKCIVYSLHCAICIKSLDSTFEPRMKRFVGCLALARNTVFPELQYFSQ